MAMVNMNNLLNGKDSRWLQLEVCREFQRNKCSRPDTECKFAHPPANVEVQNGRVTACYDSIKGRCNREKPPCKYFHPPQHLKDQLLINGRNHLALKNALMQQMGLTPGQPLVPGQVQAVAANPYLTGMPQVGSTYSPYFAPGPIMPTIMGPDPTGVGSPLGVVPQTVVTQQKMPRSDRLEMDMKSVGSFYYDNFAFPGMMPYKRPAADKSGVPVYQPNATTYQQLMQLQQPFVPVSCEYSVAPHTIPSTSCASSTPNDLQQQDTHSNNTLITATTNSATTSTAVTSIAAQATFKEAEITTNSSSTSSSATSANSSTVIVAATTTIAATTTTNSNNINSSNSSINSNTTIAASTLPPNANIPDPAALAKEVAQQNYAKAVKLAAVSQSLAFNQLNPLNYTGVALNKQAVTVPPPALARYPTALTFGLGTATAGLNLGIPNPYSMAAAAAAQQNLINMSRPPPAAIINPYSLIRTPYPTAASTAPLLSNSLLGAQYPVAVSASQITNATASANIAAAAAQNNNNVVIQPYKKLKTT